MGAKKKNLVVRTLTGIAFVAIMVLCIEWSHLSFMLLFLAITALTVWEFTGLMSGNSEVNRMITTVSGAYLFLAFSSYISKIMPGVVFVPYVLSVLYLLIEELFLKRANPVQNWMVAFASHLYIALPFSLLSCLVFNVDPADGSTVYVPMFALAIFVFLWCNDTGAYCVGTLFGKHKMFPRISPAKSWEGTLGGTVVAVACSYLIYKYTQVSTPLIWAGLAIVVVVFGTLGDLVESQLKRTLGIKDSGNILPGHGGILDRFDSSLAAIPAAVCYLHVVSYYF
jgi:phosphatidate cytidylyltransferase